MTSDKRSICYVLLVLLFVMTPALAAELSGTRIGYVENFVRGVPGDNADLTSNDAAVRARTNPDWEVTGDLGGNNTISKASDGGVLLWVQGSTAGDELVLRPHTNTQQTGWETTDWIYDASLDWECVVQINGSLSELSAWAGLVTPSPSSSTYDDQLYLLYDPNDPNVPDNWIAVASIDGTETRADTGVAVRARVDYHFRIETYQEGNDWKAKFYIDDLDTAVHTTGALQGGEYTPMVGLKQLSVSNGEGLRIRGIALSRNLDSD